jgi:hypothetical protein
MKRRPIRVATILLLASAGTSRAAMPIASTAQCEAAWFYAQTIRTALRGHRLVFETGPIFFGISSREAGDWFVVHNDRPEQVPGPPASLLHDLTSKSALHFCPMLRDRLTALHLRFGRAAVRWAAHLGRGGLYRATIATITLPAISADGRHAVLGESTVSGPLGGGASLIHLVRDAAGRWQVAGSRGLWIS